MTGVIATLDDYGKPAWIALMVLGFIVFWPVGLAVLAYMLWSGRMSCGGRLRSGRWQEKMQAWGRGNKDGFGRTAGFGFGAGSSGNAAFDEYREATLKRLEEEQEAFRDFLDRLRMARDRAEFDEFMAERRATAAGRQQQHDPAAPAGGKAPVAEPGSQQRGFMGGMGNLGSGSVPPSPTTR